MIQTRARLKVSDITISQVLKWSTQYWGREVDDKRPRAWQDIQSAKFTFRRGLEYNKSTKEWEQTGREVKLEFIMKTEPTSYNKTDNISPHVYPITFIIRKWELGFDSPFRCRVGSFFKPEFPTKKVSQGINENDKERIRKQNKSIQERNISRGIQLQFFFDSMWVYAQNGLLFGPDWTNGPPKVRNKQHLIFFSKHEYWLIIEVFPRIFAHPKLNQIFRN